MNSVVIGGAVVVAGTLTAPNVRVRIWRVRSEGKTLNELSDENRAAAAVFVTRIRIVKKRPPCETLELPKTRTPTNLVILSPYLPTICVGSDHLTYNPSVFVLATPNDPSFLEIHGRFVLAPSKRALPSLSLYAYVKHIMYTYIFFI